MIFETGYDYIDTHKGQGQPTNRADDSSLRSQEDPRRVVNG